MVGAVFHSFQRAALAAGCAACLMMPAAASVIASTSNAAKVAKTAGEKNPNEKNVHEKSAPQVDWCKRFSTRLSSLSLATCQQLGLIPTGTTSVQGFPILKRQIPAVQTSKNPKPPVRVLLIGGIHGDELTSPAVVFKWLQWMHMPPAQDFHWSVAPVVNPDGFLAPKARRMNANGVDLNRNFPTPNWHKEAPQYWIQRTGRDPRRFPGKAPLSEPESRWVNDEIMRFKPDVIISVHAPFGVLDFDGPVQPPRNFGRLVFTPVGVYPGSLGNYSGMHKNVPIITIELPHALSMPSEAEARRIWQDMLVWIQRNVSPPEPAPAKPVKSLVKNK